MLRTGSPVFGIQRFAPQAAAGIGERVNVAASENQSWAVGAGVREQHFSRFDGQQPHRRGRGTKLYRSFYMR
jgi:hypothetical protein